MPFVITETLDIVRLLILVGTWVIIPINLWTYYQVRTQLREWQANEAARVQQWRDDMAAAAKLLEECGHQRALTEVALAMARRQTIDSARTPD